MRCTGFLPPPLPTPIWAHPIPYMTNPLPEQLFLDALTTPAFVDVPVTSHDLLLGEPIDALAAGMANVSITPMSALPPCARPEHRQQPAAGPSAESSSRLRDGPGIRFPEFFFGDSGPTMVSA